MAVNLKKIRDDPTTTGVGKVNACPHSNDPDDCAMEILKKTMENFGEVHTGAQPGGKDEPDLRISEPTERAFVGLINTIALRVNTLAWAETLHIMSRLNEKDIASWDTSDTQFMEELQKATAPDFEPRRYSYPGMSNKVTFRRLKDGDVRLSEEDRRERQKARTSIRSLSPSPTINFDSDDDLPSPKDRLRKLVTKAAAENSGFRSIAKEAMAKHLEDVDED
eukprot:GFYU01011631.1.p1 GENE.GFYU01011631.1~~GFYU01011631.1.p1  ORF type:complete len:238 (-),score=61.94 GFYU01011631.1:53-718(-)